MENKRKLTIEDFARKIFEEIECSSLDELGTELAIALRNLHRDQQWQGSASEEERDAYHQKEEVRRTWRELIFINKIFNANLYSLRPRKYLGLFYVSIN